MVGFYRHHIQKWRGGTGSLTNEQYRVYHVIIEQIMSEEGAIILHEKAMAGVANMHWRTFRFAFNDLVSMGKLRQLPDGRVTNGRADAELASIENNRENARLGGLKSAQTRRRGGAEQEHSDSRAVAESEHAGKTSNKNNGEHEAALERPMKPIREEKTIKKREDSCSSDDERFREFWRMYPRKVGKKDAAKAYRGALRDTRPEAILKALAEQIPKWRDPKFIPYPATWLRDGRWDDEEVTQTQQTESWQKVVFG